MSGTNLVEITADIVAAYVSNNEVISNDLPSLIEKVHATLQEVMDGAGFVGDEAHKPAVPIKQSVFDDYLICLEDGQKFKSLKRHLKAHYDMSPEQYRTKWGLPSDYPMVAPLYAEQRSMLAKKIGLGTSRAGTKNKKTTKVA
ncbi:MAG: putative transcriptional regulator [Alphaproteobacteria bacterium]|jgi:predicted transcriptional regulator